jgi:hypothetical protein
MGQTAEFAAGAWIVRQSPGSNIHRDSTQEGARHLLIPMVDSLLAIYPPEENRP